MTVLWNKFSGWLLVPFLALVVWSYATLHGQPEHAAREWLTRWSGNFLAMTTILILLTALFHMRTKVRAIPKQLAWLLPIIGLGGALYTGLMAPQTHRIYYDETIYLSIGQNLTHLNRAQLCNAGGEDYGQFRCEQWEYNKQPNGFPFLTSLVFRIFGVSEQVIFIANNLLLGLVALVVFFMVSASMGSWLGGGIGALILLLVPQNLHWYNTTAVEPSAAFFASLVILIALIYRKTKTNETITLLTALTAFAIQFRPESLLLLPLVMLLVVRTALTKPKALMANILLFVVLTLPLWLHMELFHNHPWGSTGKPFSFEYFIPNLNVNGWHFLDNKEFPFLFTVLAMVGLVWPGPGWLERGLIGLWFLLFWGVFLFFYAGSYHYGADIRYAILSYPPLAVLAGLGAERIILGVTRIAPDRPWMGIMIALCLVSHLPFLPLVRAKTDEAWAARADHRFAQEMATKLPTESLILSQNPSMFQLWGHHAAQMSLANTDPAYVNRMMFDRYRGGVYLHFNFWCNVPDPVQNAFCKDVLKLYDHELMVEYREKEYVYALYRLRPKNVSKQS